MSNLAAPFRYRQFCDALTVLFLLAIAIAFIPYGELNLTYDSFDFLAASESLDVYLHGKNQDGFSYLTRAPLLPAYLHFFNAKIQGAWWLNMISLVGSILLMFKIARTLNIQDFLIYPFVIVTTLTYPWLLNHFFLWGEPPFTFLILALIYCLIENKSFLMIMVMCVLLFLVRKAGIFFFVSVSAWYFFIRDRKKVLISMTIAVVVFLSWQILEHSYDSTSTFLNMFNKKGVVYQRIYYVEAVTSWVFPMKIPHALRMLMFVIAMAGIIFLGKEALPNILKERKNLLLMTIALTYMICIMGFSGTSGYMDAERYLNVVLPIWMLLLISFANEVHTKGGVRSKIFLGIVTVWIVYPLSRTFYHLL